MKKIILIINLLLLSATLQAQVWKFPIDALRNSIVRTVDDNYVLIYTQPTVDSAFFLLYKEGDGAALVFRVPAKWEVHDVRIHNSTDAYFCGTYGGKGLIGMFEIFPVFTSSGSVHYGVCNWTTHGYVMPVDFKRLDLYEAGGTVNMAMTGTTLWHYLTLLPNTAVTSAYLSGGNWNVCCFANKGPAMTHTDVACLDNMIVSAGMVTDGDKCCIKTFQKVQNFPTQVMIPYYMTVVDYPNMRGDVLAAHKTGDEVVLAQFHQGGNGVNTVLFDIPLSSTTGVPISSWIDLWPSVPTAYTPWGTAWRQMELNCIGDSVWLLQKAEYAGTVVSSVADRLQRIPLLPGMGVAKMWHPIICNAQSMDLARVFRAPHLSGHNVVLELYEPIWDNKSGNCYLYDEIWYGSGLHSCFPQEIDDGWDDEQIQETTYLPPVFTVKVTYSCENTSKNIQQ
ncbi:MAG: hypothetical protein J6X79_05815 [Bacteroidales bacterium]|nr:hypothetical protein [Bacteroidales bacterium]